MSKSKFKQIPQPVRRNLSSTKVNIVTPVYGSPKFLEAMLDSLLKYEAGISWDITLVDDLGPDREEVDEVYREYSKRDGRIKILRNKINLGFAGSNNEGFSKGSASLLLMLNSDVLVTHDNWLSNMAREFDTPNVGAVGPKLLFFDKDCPNYSESPIRQPGKIQHAGVSFNMVGNPFHIFMGWDAEHPKVTKRLEVNCVTGACLMTRRNYYKSVGGLDIDYGPGNFEDVQYCLQMRSAGQKVIYLPTVSLYHFAGGSNNTATAVYNLTLFQLKCKKFIEYDDWKRY